MRTALTPIALFSIASSLAQWSNDPANPTVISGTVQYVTGVLPDDNNGHYVFWTDFRDGGADAIQVYGQHVSSTGGFLWENGGRAIHAEPGLSIQFAIMNRMADGSFMLTYTCGYNNARDSLRTIRLGDEGEPLWAAPVTLARIGTDAEFGVISSVYANTTWVDGDSLVVCFGRNYPNTGGTLGYQRIALDGGLAFPGNGINLGVGKYALALTTDGAGGFLFVWRSSNTNGSSSSMQRFDRDGNALWGDSTDLTGSTDGYDGHVVNSTGFGAITHLTRDDDGFVMIRVDATGSPTWSPVMKPVSSFASYQDHPAATRVDGELVVAWKDDRPPAVTFDLYVQRFDANGDPIWNPDGVPGLVGVTASSIAWPSIVPGANGSVFTGMPSTDGLVAQRILEDGTSGWPTPVLFCNYAFNPYVSFSLRGDGAGGVVCFWKGGPGPHNNTLFGGHINAAGMLGGAVGVEELNAAEALVIFPNPASDQVNISIVALLNGERAVLELFDASGRRVHAEEVPALSANVSMELASTLREGLYLVMLRTAGREPLSARVVLRR